MCAAAADATEGIDGVHFVSDMADAVVPDHTACAKEPYVNPFSATTAIGDLTGGRGKKQELLHPNVEGYQAMTSRLVEWSDRDEQQPKRDDEEAPLAGQIEVRAEDWGTGDPTGTIAIDAPMESQPGQVTIGKRIRLTASGFAPDSSVTVTLYSTPRTLGPVTADAEGAVNAVLPVPPDVSRGDHVLEDWGTGTDGETKRYVRAVTAASGLPWLIVAVGVGSVLALLAGTALLVRVLHLRRQPPQGPDLAGSTPVRIPSPRKAMSHACTS